MQNPSVYQAHLLEFRNTILQHDDVYTRLKKARAFMEKTYMQGTDLDQMAAAAHFSKFHFIRIFKNTYGCTPHQYLTELKIDRAKTLLMQNKPVSEICYTLGFTSLASFTFLFKRKTGCLPSAFSKKTNNSGEAGIFLKYPVPHFPTGK